MHVGNLYYTEPAIRLAARLSELSLGGKAFLCNSGAEAIECALKLARRHRAERRLRGAWRAASTAARWARSPPRRRRPSRRRSRRWCPASRWCRATTPPPLAEAVTANTAAVLLEPIQGEGGIHPLSAETLAAARAACDEHGALLIFDEIQCGMGRTGDMWGWEAAGVRPDVMTVAKGLGGGLPIGACLTTPELADTLQPGDHGSTFAGGPVVASGAHAVLDVVTRRRFPRRGRPEGRAAGGRPARARAWRCAAAA